MVQPFRDKIVLTTKFTPCRVGDQDISDAEKLTAKGIRKALEDSLRRLGTDYIDCYYEHRVPLASRPEEVAEVMGEPVHAGADSEGACRHAAFDGAERVFDDGADVRGGGDPSLP